MSEDKEHAVADEVDVKPDEAVTETDSAQEQKSEDDLESALAEFERDTGESSTEQKVETKTDDTADRLKRLEQQLSERDYQTDIGRVITDIRGDLNQEQFDDEFMDTWINAQAKKDERIARAWMNRHTDPNKFAKVVGGLGREFTKRYGKLSAQDEDATSDREAVAAAVRGTGKQAPEEKAPDYSQMSDNEFREAVKKQHGFNVPI